MTIGDGIAVATAIGSSIWGVAWILSIHLKGGQGHWYPSHLEPKALAEKSEKRGGDRLLVK